MTGASVKTMLNIALLAFSLACAAFAAKRPAKDRGFFSLPPALRGVLAFLFGPAVLGCAIVAWPLTLFIWYIRRFNLWNRIDNTQMMEQLKNLGPMNRR
jgi:hypothetical protein